MVIIPHVIERSARGERAYDVYSRLLLDRIVFLGSGVNDDAANALIAQLLFLEADDPGKEIHFYINSPGGSVTAGMGIYDTMQYISSPVNTTCLGLAASMGALLLAAGTGRRSALPNSRIMLHQPSGGARGTAADIEIEAREILSIRERLDGILSSHTGRPMEKIREDLTRDRWMSPEEAVAYGVIDEVIPPNKAHHAVRSRRAAASA